MRQLECGSSTSVGAVFLLGGFWVFLVILSFQTDLRLRDFVERKKSV